MISRGIGIVTILGLNENRKDCDAFFTVAAYLSVTIFTQVVRGR